MTEGLGSFPLEWEKSVAETSLQGGIIKQQVFGHDHELSVKFYLRPTVNEFKTEKENFKVIDYIEHVKIQRFGDRTTVYDQPANDSHRKRFPQHYHAFRNDSAKEIGIPLSAWDYQLSETDILTFKLLGIEYVHQIAQMGADQQQSLGLDQRHIVARAKIDTAEMADKNAASKLQMKFDDTEKRLRELEEQNRTLLDLMSQKTSERVEREERVEKSMELAAASPVTVRQVSDIFESDVPVPSKKTK